jgi:hypothetical protein
MTRYSTATLRLTSARGGRVLRTVDLSAMTDEQAEKAIRRLRNRRNKLDMQYGAVGHTVDVTFKS